MCRILTIGGIRTELLDVFHSIALSESNSNKYIFNCVVFSRNKNLKIMTYECVCLGIADYSCKLMNLTCWGLSRSKFWFADMPNSSRNVSLFLVSTSCFTSWNAFDSALLQFAPSCSMLVYLIRQLFDIAGFGHHQSKSTSRRPSGIDNVRKSFSGPNGDWSTELKTVCNHTWTRRVETFFTRID